MSNESVLEQRIVGTFAALAEFVPDVPAMTWADAKLLRSHGESDPPVKRSRWRGKSGRSLLSIGIAVGLAGAGTAAAAASGVFDSRATKVFQGFASVPEPAAWGYLPGFNPKKEVEEITNPGPEGTTVSLWNYQETPDLSCQAIIESSAGQQLFPGKKGTGTSGGCSGSIPNGATPTSPLPPPPPPQDRVYGADAGLWRSPKGNLYYLVGGQTPPDATRLQITFSDGNIATIRVHNGWFVTAIPKDRWDGGYTGLFFGANSQQILGRELH